MNVPGDHLLTFACVACQSALTVPASLSGVTGPCPICGQSITAPPAAPPVGDLPCGPRVPSGSSLRRVDGPPEKSTWFTKVGVALFVALLASPFLILGGMVIDMKGMFDAKQAAHQDSEEYHLINAIDQIVHPSDPKWQEQGGVDMTQGAILLEGARIRHQDEVQTGKPFDISTLMSGGDGDR